MIILCCLLGFFLFVLFTPVFFSVSVCLPNAKDITVRLWGKLFCLEMTEEKTRVVFLGIGFTFYKKEEKAGKQDTTKDVKTEKSEKKKKKKKKRTSISRKISGVIRDTDFIKAWLTALKFFLKRVLTVIHFRALSINLSAGLESPAQTGQMMGVWYAFQSTLGSIVPPRFQLSLSPNFVANKISGNVEVRANTSFIRLLVPLFVLLRYAPLYKTIKIFIL